MKTKILLVDDDKLYHESIADVLGAYPYKLLFACTATEALLMQEKEKPDLAIVDINLVPTKSFDNSGLTLVKTLLKSLPVIILSNTDNKSNFQTMIHAYGGRVKYVPKGKEDELASTIEAALAARRSPLRWLGWLLVALLAFLVGWNLQPFSQAPIQSLTGGWSKSLADNSFVQGVLASLVASAVWLPLVWIVSRFVKRMKEVRDF